MYQRVIYFEIPSKNPERSRQFFTDAFGWEFKTLNDIEYWQINNDEADNTGIIGRIIKKGDMIPNVVNLIRVKNIEEAMICIVKAGGKAISLQKTIPSVGWVRYFADPDGHIHGIVQLEPIIKRNLMKIHLQNMRKIHHKPAWQYLLSLNLWRKQ